MPGRSDVAERFDPRRIDKPWGYELIWADAEPYVGKILHVKAGEALSLQYHRVKDETLHLLRGSLLFEVGSSPDALREESLAPGESFRITAGTLHRMTALEDSDVLEVSTNHLEDVVRLDDRYGRVGRRT